jgi:hypothetical protein
VCVGVSVFGLTCLACRLDGVNIREKSEAGGRWRSARGCLLEREKPCVQECRILVRSYS